MPIRIEYVDEEDKKKKLQELYDKQYKQYFGESDSASKSSSNYNNNTSENSNNLWEQIKTTAGNMFGNVGYGLGNGLIGFAQNERRNKTASKSLDMLNKMNVSNPTSALSIALGNLGKSLKSTLDFTLKDNNTYNSLKKANEDNKNTILNFIDEKLQNQEDINNENIQKNIQETTNPVGQKLVEIAPSIGQMIPSAIPGVGTLYSVGSATDSYYDEAKSRGMNEEQASNYSQLMGMAEGLTEMIGVGKLVKGGKGIAKGTIKEGFKDLGISIADNFMQEAVTEPISELVTKGTAGDEYLKNDYRTSEGWKNLGKDMLQSGFDGAITAGIMGGVSAGLGKSINIYNKLRNGQQPTANEYKSAFDEQRANGIDVDGNIQNEFKNRINQSANQNTNQLADTQQDIASKLNEIVQNDKYLSQEDKQAMIYATNDLASKNQLDSNNTLEAINQIKQMSQLSQEQNEQLDIGKKYLSGRKEIYNKYRSVTDYDNSIVQQAKDVVPSNKQGKRTKEQWLDVAKYIGTNIADKSNSEIQEIAYKSWQEETPNNSATLNKQGQKYVKFMSDEWIDTIYDAVEKQRQKSGYVANNDTVNALDNFYKEYTNNQITQNTVENTSNNLYNTNIDRGDKNEQIQREGMAGIPGQYGTGIQQNEKQQNNKKYTRKEYEEFEKSVKQIESNKLTEGQRKLIDNYKRQYNKNIVFFDGQQNNNGYLGGASLNDKNKIYVDVNSAKTFGENKIINHELMESDILHNREISNDIIQPAIQKIIDDPEFQNQKLAFWENQEGDMPSDYAIAKDILCDRFAEIRTGEKTDYNNVLSQATNMNIDFALENFYKSLYGKDLKENSINKETKTSIKQSQSFLENQIGSSGKGKTVQELRLPTKENWDIVKNNNKNSKDLPDTKQFIVEKRTKKKLPIKEIKDELAQKIINKGHYIDKLAKKTEDKNLTYLYDRTLNSFNEAQISIGDNQVNSKGEVVGKSLNDIFKQAEEMELNVDFEDYLLNKHNIARTAFGKSIYGDTVSAPQSKRITENYEKQHPEFKEWAKEVNKYNDNNLKDLVDNGLVSKETYDKLKEMYGDYVPTYRDITETMQEFEDNRVGNNTLKSATKSNKNILSVKESMAEQTLAIKKAIRINNIGKELYKILGKDSKIMDGIEVDPTLMYTLDGEVVEKAKDGQNTFAIFDDGEITYFKISDDIYSAFSKDTLQNKINNSEVAKALLTPVEKLSQVQRNLLTTYSIGFAFNNPIKDFQDAVFNSKYSTGQFLKNYSKALYNIAKNGDWYKSYKNNGGTANTYFDYNKGLLPTKTKNPIKKFVNKIKDVNEILEQAPRLSEYISTIENNGSIDEALYNAAEITTNFKRGGDIAKVANKYGANFLNASIQGLDKFYRNLSGQNGWKGYARLLTKATLFQVVPSIVNGLLLKDDDDYSDLPEYTKDNYFLFKIGDGKFFRIPKGRVSSLIGGLSRRVLETAEGKKVNWKSLVDTTVNQMAPNNPFSDNVLAPIKQAIENKAWYGGEIVSSRLQKLPTAEQYDEKTDNLSKIIGKYTGISPKKINYVLDQYSGGIGDVLLPMMTPQAENNILEDKFTTDAILKNKNVSKYYEEVDNLEKNKNSENATDNDILKYKYMTEVSKDLSDLYSEKRNIENSNLSDKEKKVKVRKVQKEINNIVEERLDNVETINSNSKVAKIGDSQYYKYHGEWTKLSDDEKEKNKKISLKSYADFKNKVYNETEKQRKSGDLKENQQLKNTSKSEILLKSNYSNKEKLALYKNYVSSTDKKVEVAVEKLNMPIDVYLNYKTNQFENDKNKDGETISGTKKQKVYNYVNSLDNVDLIYKYMIVKMEGINDSDGDKAIINYVNKSQKFNFEERKEALKTLGFKVDKYGNVENMIFIPIKSKIK